MGAIRTALALGALVVSVPLYAQGGRYGWDRSRAERGNGARDDRQNDRKDARSENRNDKRGDNRGIARAESRNDDRGGNRGWGRNDGRGDPRGGRPEIVIDRRDRRDDYRVQMRPPVVIDRWDRRDGRVEGRYGVFGRAGYRYGDRDFRHRDVLRITAWFHTLPPARLSAYGYYDRGWDGVRYSFRPGLYLSMDVYGRLGVLPYELELELGDLPWYLERRLYGRTVLVVDVRTRMVVDMYDIDD